MAHQRRYESEEELAAWLTFERQEQSSSRPGAGSNPHAHSGSANRYDPRGDRSDFVAPSATPIPPKRKEQSHSRPSAACNASAHPTLSRRYDPRGARSDVVAPSAPPDTQQAARREQAPKATTQLPKPRHPSEGTCKMRCTFYHSVLCPSSKNPETVWIDPAYKPKPAPAPAPAIVPLVAIPSVIPVNKGIKLWEDFGERGGDALEMVNWEEFALENAWREREQAGSGWYRHWNGTARRG